MGKSEEKPYQVEIRRSALREIQKLPASARSKAEEEIDKLTANPFPAGVRKLAGGKAIYRIRVGDYRVIYSVDFKNHLVTIERIRHRREAYR